MKRQPQYDYCYSLCWEDAIKIRLSLSASRLHTILRDGTLAERERALRNPHCSDADLANFSHTISHSCRRSLEINPKFRKNGSWNLNYTPSLASYDEIRKIPFETIANIENPHDLHLLVRDCTDHYRILALTAPNLPEADMRDYAQSEEPLYLAALLSNPSLPDELRIKLKKEEKWKIPSKRAIDIYCKPAIEYIKKLTPYTRAAIEVTTIYPLDYILA